MPGTYPPQAPTLTNDLVSISRFLQSPTALRRRLRDYRDLRFVSDQILTNRYRSSGGAILYEMSEPFITDRAVGSVAPGAEYPQANLPTGTGAIGAVAKWGQKVPLTDEEIDRGVYAGQVVDRSLQKVVNSVIAQVDAVTMAAIGSTVTQTQATALKWDSTSGTFIMRDIMLAVQKITGQMLGYNPDTLLLTDLLYAYAASDPVISNLLRRETTDNPVYTGQIETLAGLTIVHSPHAPTDPMVLDSTQLGGMADELSGAPGYAISDLAVQVKSIRNDGADKWELQGRRITVPIVQEPASACSISGAGTP